MERKTRVQAEAGKQELTITREFDLPIELLFKAYVEPDIVEQWMGTKVLKLDTKKHGSWHFETTDSSGSKHSFSGVIHDVSPNRIITRTFEMESIPASAIHFPAQLEFLEFDKLTDTTSKLSMQIVYRSVALRDQMVKLPFAQGLNRAHNRLQAFFDT